MTPGLPPPQTTRVRAFTRLDLAVLFGTVSLLGLLLLPALAASRDAGVDVLCLNNLKRLTHAWHRFAADHNSQLPGNLDGGSNVSSSNRTWCVGWLDLTISTPDNTNSLYLRNSQLGPYVDNDLSIYRCPADPSLATYSGQTYPRVRSVSMNSYVGQSTSGTVWTSGFQQFLTLDDFNALPPRQCFIFIDEHPASINDGAFFIDMSGFDPLNPNQYLLVDLPAGYHSGGAGLAFADGHADTWLWNDPRTSPIVSGTLVLNVPSPGNVDVDRIQSVTSRKINNPTR